MNSNEEEQDIDINALENQDNWENLSNPELEKKMKWSIYMK